MQKWPLRKIPLTWSLILFMLPLIDCFVTGTREERKSLADFTWEALPGKGADLYAVTLNDNTSFRISGGAFTEFNGVDSCTVYATRIFIYTVALFLLLYDNRLIQVENL